MLNKYYVLLIKFKLYLIVHLIIFYLNLTHLNFVLVFIYLFINKFKAISLIQN